MRDGERLIGAAASAIHVAKLSMIKERQLRRLPPCLFVGLGAPTADHETRVRLRPRGVEVTAEDPGGVGRLGKALKHCLGREASAQPADRSRPPERPSSSNEPMVRPSANTAYSLPILAFAAVCARSNDAQRKPE